ncbi:elongation factor 1-gamma [Mycena rebaudengoi]|nr:elongation factor 1-gamma [Mycena rebaudengoi]
MTSIGTLWTTVPGTKQTKVILATAALGGITLDVPADYKHYEDNKKPEFLSKFPHGKIPAFEGKDGFLLFEGSPIAKYVAGLSPNSGLLGGDAKEAAQVDQWIHLIDAEISANQSAVVDLLNGNGSIPYSKQAHTYYTNEFLRAIKTVNEHLASRTFLVHERITVADLTLAAAIHSSVRWCLDPALRKTYANAIRHMETVVNNPKLKAIFGETVYCDKAPTYVPPAKKEKEAKGLAQQPKAEKKPKAKEIDEEEDEPSAPAEPKAKNPLDNLPKSNFNLEDWKRAYSNKDTRGTDGAIEWFYQNFDKEGFSVWRVDFKYPTELTLVFMSSNQIGGFFNRLEASRKYLFGSVGVLGEANNSLISGVLILRGLDVKPVVEVAPDFESYEYKKLNLDDAGDKSFFERALAWDLEVDGKKWADGKNFK